jgi:hypothetical protein
MPPGGATVPLKPFIAKDAAVGGVGEDVEAGDSFFDAGQTRRSRATVEAGVVGLGYIRPCDAMNQI